MSTPSLLNVHCFCEVSTDLRVDVIDERCLLQEHRDLLARNICTFKSHWLVGAYNRMPEPLKLSQLKRRFFSIEFPFDFELKHVHLKDSFNVLDFDLNLSVALLVELSNYE